LIIGPSGQITSGAGRVQVKIHPERNVMAAGRAARSHPKGVTFYHDRDALPRASWWLGFRSDSRLWAR
jgi:hypothetical protein